MIKGGRYVGHLQEPHWPDRGNHKALVMELIVNIDHVMISNATTIAAISSPGKKATSWGPLHLYEHMCAYLPCIDEFVK